MYRAFGLSDLFLIIAFVGALVAAGFGTYWQYEKNQCEKNLPRNVECTWQPPRSE